MHPETVLDNTPRIRENRSAELIGDFLFSSALDWIMLTATVVTVATGVSYLMDNWDVITGNHEGDA